jgi:hypothetical protein
MIVLLLFLLAPLRAEVRPARPTVGDLVTVRFAVAPDERVVVTPSPDYELVSTGRDQVVVRTFRPQPFKLHGVISGPAGARRFDELTIEAGSVLKPNAPMTPAPLEPPHREPWPKLPFLLAGLLLFLIVAAIVLWIRHRRRHAAAPVTAAVPLDPPDVELRKALDAIAASGRPRWAELADATRRYLGRVAPELGPELTTSQLLRAAKLGTVTGVIPSRRSAARDPVVESREGRAAQPSHPSPPESRGPSPSSRLRMTPAPATATPSEWLELLSEILHQGDLAKFSTTVPDGDFDAVLARTSLLTQPFDLPAEVAA